MLGRLVLLLVQFAAGYYAGPVLASYLPKPDVLDIFILALVYAVVVWLVGFIGSVIIKDVGQPSPATLTVSIAVALLFAGLTFIAPVMSAVNAVVSVPRTIYPLIGALLGYTFR